MNWFKHETDLHNDPDIVDAFDRFGHAGYCVFCIVREIYGYSFNDVDNDRFLRISLNNVRKKTRISLKKLKEVLNYFQNRKRIIFMIEDEFILLKIPEFIKLANNWTIENRNKLFNNSPVTAYIEKEVRNKKGIETTLTDQDDTSVENFEKPAGDVLKYLNACTGKNFSDARYVASLLKEGYKFGDFITIIDNKMKDEFFLSKKKLYNPRTLFNKDKFDIYKNEVENGSGADKNHSESGKPAAHDQSLIQANRGSSAYHRGTHPTECASTLPCSISGLRGPNWACGFPCVQSPRRFALACGGKS